MTYFIYDLAIGVILLLFALRGHKRGLLLTLCSLAAVLTAFVGATFAADALTPKVADIMVPKITSIVERRLADMDITGKDTLSGGDISAADGNTNIKTDDNSSNGNTAAGNADPDGNAAPDPDPNIITEAMAVLGLPAGMLSHIKDALGSLESIGDLPSALSTAIARTAAETVLYLIVFLICFLLILLLWRIISHALNLVARLPVLHFFNKTGGFILGLCKGMLFLFVLAWVLRYLGGIIPDAAVEHTYLLRFFMTVSPLTFVSGV